MSVYSIILTIATGICTSVFNLILARTGYVAPELVDGITVAAQQSQLRNDRPFKNCGFQGLLVQLVGFTQFLDIYLAFLMGRIGKTHLLLRCLKRL